MIRLCENDSLHITAAFIRCEKGATMLQVIFQWLPVLLSGVFCVGMSYILLGAIAYSFESLGDEIRRGGRRR